MTVNFKSKLEKEDVLKARECWSTEKDCKKALELFPRFCTAERAILSAYLKHGDKKNHLVAIQSIPKNLRLMYVHAYQSRVWNEMASLRIKRNGLELTIGDLVMNPANEVLVVNSENINQFSVYNVVLPMPGYSVKYPENETRNDYVEFMGQYGFDPFNMKTKIHETNLPGAYRKLVCIPDDLSWLIYLIVGNYIHIVTKWSPLLLHSPILMF